MNEQTNVETLLLNEISTLFSKLEGLKAGTDEYSKVNTELCKLIERAESMEKFHIELEEKQIEREENRKDRFIKYAIAVGTTVIEVTVLVWGAKKSWKFEETGTITSTAGRSFMGKIFGIFKRKH